MTEEDGLMAEDDAATDPTARRNPPALVRMDEEPEVENGREDRSGEPFRPGEAITVNFVAEIAARCRTLLQAGTPVTVDLAGVRDCDTAGIQLLMALRRQAIAAGTPCVFAAPSPAVMDMARSLGVDPAALFGE
jgi:ABC-type transporter Mla MlaB component